jgi:hypothetical protein
MPRPAWETSAARTYGDAMKTPTMLARTAAYWLSAQALLAVVVAAAVPNGASVLVLTGFVTAYYDDNLFAVRIVRVPWTDPSVYVSIQTLVQMVAVAAAAAALTTLVRTNPWQHGVLPDSTPPGRDRIVTERSASAEPPAEQPPSASLAPPAAGLAGT